MRKILISAVAMLALAVPAKACDPVLGGVQANFGFNQVGFVQPAFATAGFGFVQPAGFGFNTFGVRGVGFGGVGVRTVGVPVGGGGAVANVVVNERRGLLGGLFGGRNKSISAQAVSGGGGGAVANVVRR